MYFHVLFVSWQIILMYCVMLRCTFNIKNIILQKFYIVISNKHEQHEQFRLFIQLYENKCICIIYLLIINIDLNIYVSLTYFFTLEIFFLKNLIQLL